MNRESHLSPEHVGFKTPEGSTSEKEAIINSSEAFAKYMNERYPQTDNDDGEKKLNYVLSGSLATTLLARAESFVNINLSSDSTINEEEVKNLPPEARDKFAAYARPIGDFDFVPTDYYQEKQKEVQGSLYQEDPEEYRRRRKTLLWKGGGGPSFEEIPEEAQGCLKNESGQIKLMCDPVENWGSEGYAKITIDGADYYVTRPDYMVGYKVLNILQSYKQKPEKFNQDFKALLDATSDIYSLEEITAVTQEVLQGYESSMKTSFKKHNPNGYYEEFIPTSTKKTLNHPDVSDEIKKFLENLEK